MVYHENALLKILAKYTAEYPVSSTDMFEPSEPRIGTDDPPGGCFSCISGSNCLAFPQYHLWLRVHLVYINISLKFMTLNLNCNENCWTRNDNESADKRKRKFPETITGFICDLTLQFMIFILLNIIIFSICSSEISLAYHWLEKTTTLTTPDHYKWKI